MKILIAVLILFYGCVTTPQFINDKIEEINKPPVEYTVAQKESMRLNNEAMDLIAKNLSNKDSVAKAVELLRQAVEVDSTTRIVLSHYVEYLYLLGDTAKALPESKRMVNLFSDDPYSWMLRGVILAGENLESLEAIECFNRSKEIFESRGDEVNAMFSSFMAGDSESKKPDFKSKFKEALNKADNQSFSSMVDDLDRKNIIRQYKGEW